MFPNTAACAVLCGIALLLNRFAGERARPVARATALLAAAVGGLTLCEHVTGASLGIDTILVSRTWGQAAAAAPMRMGPPASTSFLLLGAALLLGTSGARAGVGAGLGVAVMAIAALSLTGYLYGAEQMFTIPRLTGIAFQTAAMLFALAVGVVASVPDHDPLRTVLEPTAAGMLARRGWPLLLAIALALGWMRVFIQERGLVDTAFGTALRTLVEILVFSGVLWWAARMVGAHERALRAAETEVRHQARQLAAFVDTAAIALHRVGPDGTILWANDA